MIIFAASAGAAASPFMDINPYIFDNLLPALSTAYFPVGVKKPGTNRVLMKLVLFIYQSLPANAPSRCKRFMKLMYISRNSCTVAIT